MGQKDTSLVMIFGTFDTVHEGHIAYASQASQYGDVIIIVARDSNVKKFKKCLAHDELTRLAQVQDAFPEHRVHLGNEENPHRVIEEYLPDVICLGYDQRSFDSDLATKFPHIKVVRLEAYKPEVYKTSKILPPCDC